MNCKCSWGFVASLVFTVLPASGAEDRFATAVQAYKAGQWSGAYGLLLEQANNGDVDAARIALFMYRYGPTLYGSHWDATPDEIDHWTKLSSSAQQRADPVFRPKPHPVRPTQVKVPAGAATTLVYRPSRPSTTSR